MTLISIKSKGSDFIPCKQTKNKRNYLQNAHRWQKLPCMVKILLVNN